MTKKFKAFTLIELMIVLAIIAVLACILVPNISRHIRDAQKTADVASAKQIYEAAQFVMMTNEKAYNEVMKDSNEKKGGFTPSQAGCSDIAKTDNRKRLTVAKIQGNAKQYGSGNYWTWTLENDHHTDTFCHDLNEHMGFTPDKKPNVRMTCASHPTAVKNNNNGKNGKKVTTDRFLISRVQGTDEIEIWACSSYGAGGGMYGIYRLWPNPDKEYSTKNSTQEKTIVK